MHKSCILQVLHIRVLLGLVMFCDFVLVRYEAITISNEPDLLQHRIYLSPDSSSWIFGPHSELWAEFQNEAVLYTDNSAQQTNYSLPSDKNLNISCSIRYTCFGLNNRADMKCNLKLGHGSAMERLSLRKREN